MTIHPHLTARKHWVLGRNRREVDVTKKRFRSEEIRRFDFDGYWSGDKWVGGPHLAMHFDSELAALDYLQANRANMEKC